MTVSGAVRPDYHTSPKYVETLGAEVADLCAMADFEPYPEQRLILDDVFALEDDGLKSAVFETAVIAPRQQLKTGVLKQAALGWLFLLDTPLVIWSAHEFSTAMEAQQDLIGLIDGCADLSRRVRKVTVAAGENAIELHSGARLRFKARTSGGGRGLTGDKIILDEAFALQPMHLGALLPTLTSVPDPQILYGSSAGLLRSDVLRGVRDRGRTGHDRLAYWEWLADRQECASNLCDHHVGTDGCALDDVEMWRKACFISARKDTNLGIIRSLRMSLPPAEFAREMLGWWDEPGADSAFSLSTWEFLQTETGTPSEPVFAIDVSPARDWAAIVAAGYSGDRVAVEITGSGGLVDHRPGTAWLLERVQELSERFNYPAFSFQAGSALEALVPDFEREGIVLNRVVRRDVASAAGHFFDLVTSGRLTHIGQDDLTDAVLVARQKHVGDAAFVWTRNGLTDLSPLYAASLAVWHLNAAGDPAQNVW